MFSEYSVWLVGVLLAVVHHYLFKFVWRRILRWGDVTSAEAVSAPLWMHVVVFHLSFALTILLVWLVCLAIT